MEKIEKSFSKVSELPYTEINTAIGKRMGFTIPTNPNSYVFYDEDSLCMVLQNSNMGLSEISLGEYKTLLKKQSI